ncbi:MAG: hypothetical protein KGL29_06740, partial [Alphaproteobacteria bacterium]|nr:hypothetical protein [Alphaproteobacteria bacterium]
MRLTPEQLGQSIANAGSALLQEAAQKLDRAPHEADRERYILAQMVGTLRGQQDQRFWMIASAIALVIGFAAFPIVSRALPFSMNADIAAA